MGNPWVEFVRQYSKDNNKSYGCAISEAGPAYRAMKQGAQAPKAPTKKRITIKSKNEKAKAEAKEYIENALNYLKKMKDNEDNILNQDEYFKEEYLKWFNKGNDMSRSDKYEELKEKIKIVCGKSTYPKTNFDCDEIYLDDIDNIFKRELDVFTVKAFPKILREAEKQKYGLPSDRKKNPYTDFVKMYSLKKI